MKVGINIIEKDDYTMILLDKIPVAVVLLDVIGSVLAINSAAERLFEIDRHNVEGSNIEQVLGSKLPIGDAEPLNCMVGHFQRSFNSKQSDFTYVYDEFDVMEGIQRYILMVQPCSQEKCNSVDPCHYLFSAMHYANRSMVVLDAQRRVVHVNHAFTEMFGYSNNEMLTLDPMSVLICPDVPAKELASNQALPWGRSSFHTEILLCGKNGEKKLTRISSSPFGEVDSELAGYSVDLIQDITEERRIRDMERDVLQALTSNLSFAELGNYICRRIEEITHGVRVSVCCIAEGRMVPWAAPSFPEEYGLFFQNMKIGEGVASCGTAAHRGEPIMVRDIGTDPLWKPYKHVMLPHGFRACWTYPVKRNDGSVAATFAFYFKQGGEPDEYLENVAEAGVHLCVLAIEREDNRLAMDNLVQFDTLTGLPNRLYMLRHLDELLHAPDPKNITILALNIERFRDVNDAMGHVQGDQALVEFGNRFHAKLGPGDLLARTQGDHFVVVSQCDGTRARWIETSLQEAVQEPLEMSGHLISLVASIGISSYPEDGQDRDTLLSNAEAAMQAKSNSRIVTSYASEGNTASKDRLLMVSALKRAVDSEGLSLHYQPQISADTLQLHGMEALARWHDRELGYIPPDKFIALAEETGQIEALSRWALREACRQLARWRNEGIQVPSVSVNMSAVNFQKNDLPEFVESLLREYSLPGSSLTIEVTESSTVALTSNMQALLGRIRGLGVGLSVDDFGTGYSSLTNLVQLPITEVKIDRSFITRALEDERLRSLVHSVVELGHSLGLIVVAEGVETADQYDLLSKFRCPVIQGYYFSRPLSPEQVPEWFSTIFAGANLRG